MSVSRRSSRSCSWLYSASANAAAVLRRVLAPEPLQDLGWGRRVGPRLAVAHRNLPPVCEARLERDVRLPVDHHHLVAGPREVPRTGRADDSGSEDDHFHSGLQPKKRKGDKRALYPPILLPETNLHF